MYSIYINIRVYFIKYICTEVIQSMWSVFPSSYREKSRKATFSSFHVYFSQLLTAILQFDTTL
jgi:hypothetical protein